MNGLRNILLLLLLVMAFLLPQDGFATVKSLSGEIEYRYADYSSEAGGRELATASHFTQKYSFLYNLQGDIYHRRAGSYSLSVGAQWYNLDTEINKTDYSLSKSKLLYSGEILLAPGGLPFRLNLFAYDRAGVNFQQDSNYYKGGVFDPDILTDVNNGVHQVVGGTLLVGIRNGSYMGRYRELLSKYPRLLVDYRQEYVKDMESLTPQHYKTRNLAFVSLNKKDNWFHYRYSDHVDYENDNESFYDKAYILGTIDHKLIRQWINLTNWIKISVDGTFAESNSLAPTAGDPAQGFYLNLFSIAKRNGTQLRNFSSFRRYQRGGQLSKRLEIPFYLHHEINPESRLLSRFVFDRGEERRELISDFDTENTDRFYFEALLETNRRRAVRFDPKLEVEAKTGDIGKGLSLRIGSKAYTNPLHRVRHSWMLGYSIASFTGESVDGDDVNYWEHEFDGSVSTSLGGVRLGVDQAFQFGTGEYEQGITNTITPVTASNLIGSNEENVARDGSVFRSTSKFYLEKSFARKINNRVEVIYDYLKKSDGAAQDKIIIEHRLRYSGRHWNVRTLSSLEIGDGITSDSGFSSSTTGGSSIGAQGNMMFNHHTMIRYAPSQYYDADLDLDYAWQENKLGKDISMLLLNQSARYHLFKANGIIRKLFTLEERFEYEQFEDVVGDPRKFTRFSLVGTYRPSRITFLRARLSYEIQEMTEKSERWIYGLGAGVSWPKLAISLDYKYGTLDGDTGEQIDDHRWEVIVRKTF